MFKLCKPREIIAAIFLSAQITTPEQVIDRIEYIPVKTTDPHYNDDLYYSALQKRFTKLFGKGHPTSPLTITQPDDDSELDEVAKSNHDPTFRAKLFLRAVTPAGNFPMDQNTKILVNFLPLQSVTSMLMVFQIKLVAGTTNNIAMVSVSSSIILLHKIMVWTDLDNREPILEHASIQWMSSLTNTLPEMY